ncbi:MAG: hypothetical protein OXC06_14920 [Acidimicrobiaceae bacterium]|nr:hypothetical protein [Acidimicrobiaceae bacterium]
MDEYVITIVARDEAETLLAVEKLDSSSHYFFLLPRDLVASGL